MYMYYMYIMCICILFNTYIASSRRPQRFNCSQLLSDSTAMAFKFLALFALAHAKRGPRHQIKDISYMIYHI